MSMISNINMLIKDFSMDQKTQHGSFEWEIIEIRYDEKRSLIHMNYESFKTIIPQLYSII